MRLNRLHLKPSLVQGWANPLKYTYAGNGTNDSLLIISMTAGDLDGFARCDIGAVELDDFIFDDGFEFSILE